MRKQNVRKDADQMWEHGAEDLQDMPELRERLDILRELPVRDPSNAAAGRVAFLEQARSLRQPVSVSRKQRLKGWKPILGKERSPMTTIVSIFIALAVALGGVGTTAYAAQDSLPNEPLYPVKEFTEDARLALTSSSEGEADLLMDYVQERVREIQALVESGEVVPPETAARLQTHLNLALQNASELGGHAMLQTLEQLRIMTQTQLKTLQQLGQGEGGSEEVLQAATRAMIQAQRSAEDGLENPVQFRLRRSSDSGNVSGEHDSTGSETGAGTTSGQGAGGENAGASGQGYGDGSGDGGDANGSGFGDGTGEGGDANGDGKGDGTPGDCTQDCVPIGEPQQGNGQRKP